MLLHKLLTVSLFLCVSVIIFNLMFEHRERQWHRANSGSLHYCVSWVPQCGLHWTFLLRVKCHFSLTMLYVDNFVEIPLCFFFFHPEECLLEFLLLSFLLFIFLLGTWRFILVSLVLVWTPGHCKYNMQENTVIGRGWFCTLCGIDS